MLPRPLSAFLVAAVVAVLPAPSAAQGKGGPKPGADPDEFWFVRDRAQSAAGAQVSAATDPWLAAALRLGGKGKLVWVETEPETAAPLDPELLAGVKDRRPLPDITGRPLDELPLAAQAYFEALKLANETSVERFAKSARKHAHVKFAHLYNDPARYRGEVIHVEGRLARLRRYDDVPRPAWNLGVREIYEGWIFGETRGAHPWWVVFTALPDGLEPAERTDKYVSFDGYFYGLVRYVTAEKGERDTPLLIGSALVLKNPPPATAEPTSPISGTFLTGMVAFFFGVVMVVVVLSWWLRRGDQRVRHQLNVLQAERTIAMLENEAAPPPPGPTGAEEQARDANGFKAGDGTAQGQPQP